MPDRPEDSVDKTHSTGSEGFVGDSVTDDSALPAPSLVVGATSLVEWEGAAAPILGEWDDVPINCSHFVLPPVPTMVHFDVEAVVPADLTYVVDIYLLEQEDTIANTIENWTNEINSAVFRLGNAEQGDTGPVTLRTVLTMVAPPSALLVGGRSHPQGTVSLAAYTRIVPLAPLPA